MSDVALLFSRDPLKMTDSDIDQIIAYYQKQRGAFKATGKPQPKLTEAEAAVQKLDIDLGGLKL